MDAFHPTFAHLIATAAGALIAAIWEGAVLTAGAAILLKFLPGMTASARSRVWTGVFLIAILLPLVPALHTSASIAIPAKSPLQVGFAWALALVALWTLLSLYRGVQLLRSAWRLLAIARRATPISAADDLKKLLQISPNRRSAQLCSSGDVDVPCVSGFFKPLILLPTSLLDNVSSEDLSQIILHEMEHLRRNDDWTNLMQKLGLVLFPLNPVVLWVERRLCLERELACDDGVLLSTGAGKAYATCLTNLAEQSLLRRGVSLALGAWQRQPELSRRVHRILRASEQELKPKGTLISSGATFASVLVAAIALTGAPQLVAFGSAARVQAVMPATAVSIPAPVTRTWPTPHPTLVNAIMPEPQATRTVPAKKRAVQRRPEYLQTTQRTTEPAPWLVMTRWEDEDATPHMVLTVANPEDSQFTYAAVPVQNGWLIVKL